MGLDEVTQICPVPLPVWLSDSRIILSFRVIHACDLGCLVVDGVFDETLAA
jgi:hypothetical protein